MWDCLIILTEIFSDATVFLYWDDDENPLILTLFGKFSYKGHPDTILREK